MGRRFDRKKLIRELTKLAFSDPTDAVALAFLPEGSDISGMNVSMVTELKVGEKGGNQVKLLDRIKQILPCHLDILYTLQYLTWKLLEGYGLTWSKIEAAGLTWSGLECY